MRKQREKKRSRREVPGAGKGSQGGSFFSRGREGSDRRHGFEDVRGARASAWREDAHHHVGRDAGVQVWRSCDTAKARVLGETRQPGVGRWPRDRGDGGETNADAFVCRGTHPRKKTDGSKRNESTYDARIEGPTNDERAFPSRRSHVPFRVPRPRLVAHTASTRASLPTHKHASGFDRGRTWTARRGFRCVDTLVFTSRYETSVTNASSHAPHVSDDARVRSLRRRRVADRRPRRSLQRRVPGPGDIAAVHVPCGTCSAKPLTWNAGASFCTDPRVIRFTCTHVVRSSVSRSFVRVRLGIDRSIDRSAGLGVRGWETLPRRHVTHLRLRFKRLTLFFFHCTFECVVSSHVRGQHVSPFHSPRTNPGRLSSIGSGGARLVSSFLSLLSFPSLSFPLWFRPFVLFFLFLFPFLSLPRGSAGVS